MSMFVDKSVTFVDVVYLKYFIDLIEIHEYNRGPHLLGLLVLEVWKSLSLKDKTVDGKMLVAYSNLLLFS